MHHASSPPPPAFGETAERKEHRIDLGNFLFRTAAARDGVITWFSFEPLEPGIDGKPLLSAPVAVDFGTDDLQSENSMHLHIGLPGDYEDVDVLTIVTPPNTSGLDGAKGWTIAAINQILADYWATQGQQLEFLYSATASETALDEVKWSLCGGPGDTCRLEDIPAEEHPAANRDGSVKE